MPNPVDPARDALIRQMRDQIVDNDVAIVAAINRRIELVNRLRAYKAVHGLAFEDPDREAWLHRFVQGANRGPLSSDGLSAIYADLLALTKRETAGDDG